jgi:hypothetical protein
VRAIADTSDMKLRLMLGAITVGVGVGGQPGVASAEVPSAKVVAVPPPPEASWWQDRKVWEKRSHRRTSGLKAGVVLASLGTAFTAVLSGFLVDAVSRPHGLLWLDGPSYAAGFALCGSLVATGVPLIVWGATPHDRPERPRVVWAAIGDRAAGLGVSF